MGYKRYCISCGKIWGNGEDIGSSGICPECFSTWINSKRKINGFRECYGEFEKYFDVNCSKCTVAKLCFQDTYGIE